MLQKKNIETIANDVRCHILGRLEQKFLLAHCCRSVNALRTKSTVYKEKLLIYCLLFIVYCGRYVNALRTKSTVYKEKRAELSELRAESGVLARTCEVINIVMYGFNLMQALSYI